MPGRGILSGFSGAFPEKDFSECAREGKATEGTGRNRTREVVTRRRKRKMPAARSAVFTIGENYERFLPRPKVVGKNSEKLRETGYAPLPSREDF